MILTKNDIGKHFLRTRIPDKTEFINEYLIRVPMTRPYVLIDILDGGHMIMAGRIEDEYRVTSDIQKYCTEDTFPPILNDGNWVHDPRFDGEYEMTLVNDPILDLIDEIKNIKIELNKITPVGHNTDTPVMYPILMTNFSFKMGQLMGEYETYINTFEERKEE